jgi:hypothetical protein
MGDGGHPGRRGGGAAKARLLPGGGRGERLIRRVDRA